MGGTAAVRGAEARYRQGRRGKAGNGAGKGALVTLVAGERVDRKRLGGGQQVVDVPARAPPPAQMAGDAGSQATQSAPNIYVEAGWEDKAPQPANLERSFAREVKDKRVGAAGSPHAHFKGE